MCSSYAERPPQYYAGEIRDTDPCAAYLYTVFQSLSRSERTHVMAGQAWCTPPPALQGSFTKLLLAAILQKYQ